MAWWQIWKQNDDEPARTPEVTMPEGSRTAPRDGRLVRPAEPTGPPQSPSRAERRRTELERRRSGLLFDVEQGELAQTDPNPWGERIALLDQTLATIRADRGALDAMPLAPSWELPAEPIRALGVTPDEPAAVRFSVADEPFLYQEAIDWDQRGGAIVRGDLQHQAGDVAAIVPANTPHDLRSALEQHLASSLLSFATDMRDRGLERQDLPETPTLRDLAMPCPECGGWRNWGGRCAACAERDLRRQALHAEAVRIQDERAAEAEIRHRLIERLPLARRRLADVEAELTTLRSNTS